MKTNVDVDLLGSLSIFSCKASLTNLTFNSQINPNQPVSISINPHQPKSTQINPNQSESIQINLNQPE